MGVMTPARDQADAITIAVHEQPEAVVFHLVDPGPAGTLLFTYLMFDSTYV